jgi:folate-dependent tRNA-U54 methylase TrmFO/GidA
MRSFKFLLLALAAIVVAVAQEDVVKAVDAVSISKPDFDAEVTSKLGNFRLKQIISTNLIDISARRNVTTLLFDDFPSNFQKKNLPSPLRTSLRL